MALVSLNCPNCGGSLKMEDTMDKGFCMFCGTSFIVKDEIQRIQVEHTGEVELSRNKELDNLLVRAKQLIADIETKIVGLNIRTTPQTEFNSLFSELKRIDSDYLEKVLDISPDNETSKKLKIKICQLTSDLKKKEVEFQAGMADATMKSQMSGCFVWIALAVLILIIFWFIGISNS